MKVAIFTCGSCKGRLGALTKVSGVSSVETDSSGYVITGKFSIEDVEKVMKCHRHSMLRMIENVEEKKKDEKKKDEKKKDEKEGEKKKWQHEGLNVYTHTFNLHLTN